MVDQESGGTVNNMGIPPWAVLILTGGMGLTGISSVGSWSTSVSQSQQLQQLNVSASEAARVAELRGLIMNKVEENRDRIEIIVAKMGDKADRHELILVRDTNKELFGKVVDTLNLMVTHNELQVLASRVDAISKDVRVLMSGKEK